MSSIFRKLKWATVSLVSFFCSISINANGQQAGYSGGSAYHFGTPAGEADIKAWDKDVRPDGTGLPAGSGTYEKGREIYAQKCALCHGPKLQGVVDPNLPDGGGPALIGGRGTLNSSHFKITVESYWPFSTTLFDYVQRAMPYTAPSSLDPDEIYCLVAYILGEAQVIDKTMIVDAKSLPGIRMPNRAGFYPDDRPFPVKRFD